MNADKTKRINLKRIHRHDMHNLLPIDFMYPCPSAFIRGSRRFTVYSSLSIQRLNLVSAAAMPTSRNAVPPKERRVR